MIISDPPATLTLHDRTVIKDEHFRDLKFVVGDDVPHHELRIFIWGSNFERCDLSELRNVKISHCMFDSGTKLPAALETVESIEIAIMPPE